MYSDSDIANMDRVSTATAAEYLGMSVNAVQCGLIYGSLPIGTAIKGRKHYIYDIRPKALVAYKNGKISTSPELMKELLKQLTECVRLTARAVEIIEKGSE